ncbi:MAG: hypothetical protein MUC57_13960 [Desulfobacterales bacterium]|nr:hypothetical protein [Desulfobacterales bacterium]
MVEESGIPTISMGNEGSMLGEPGNAERQRRILLDALEALRTMRVPGTIQELPYRWKRPD